MNELIQLQKKLYASYSKLPEGGKRWPRIKTSNIGIHMWEICYYGTFLFSNHFGKVEGVHAFISYTFMSSEIDDKLKLQKQVDEAIIFLLNHNFCVLEKKEGWSS